MNFDRIAPWYRWLEYLVFGRALQRRRVEYLGDIRPARRALILGDGDGRFTAEFLRASKVNAVDSIDLSAAMLRLAERRFAAETDRIRLIAADALKVDFGGPYDLVVSHFFLDCFTSAQLVNLIGRISAATKADARWLVSEFRIPGEGVGRYAGFALTGFLYFCFRFATGLKTKRLPDYASVLRTNGFHIEKQRVALGGLLVSELWARQMR